MVNSYRSIISGDLSRFPDPEKRKDCMLSADGAGQILSERGYHFCSICEERLRERINEFSCVIIPEQDSLEDETIEAIRNYIQNGGKVIISQATSGDPSILCDIAGVKHLGFNERNYGYIGTKQPFHIKAPFSKISCKDAEILYQAKCPLKIGRAGYEFGHGLSPYTEEDESPVITRRAVGSAEVVYIATPIFKAYAVHQNPYTEKLLIELLEHAIPNRLVKVSTKARVEMSMMRKDDDLIIHLVNHSGNERISSWVFPLTDYVPYITDIDIQIRIGDKRPEMYFMPNDELVNYDVNGDYAILHVPELHYLNSVIVPGFYQ